MRFQWLACLPLLLAAADLSYAQSSYVDPALHALLQPGLHAAAQRAANGLPAAGVAMRRSSAIDVARVALFAQVRDEAGIAALNRIGARIGSRIGNIITAEIPLDNLDSILRSPHFVMLEAAREVTLASDSNMRAIRAHLVRSVDATGSWRGAAGRGVVVGVYDTGLDFTHDDFLDANGQTRVLGIWDQTALAGMPPAGFGYGHFCDRASIQQSVQAPAVPACSQTDMNGHGTHVMGTAAGDGSAAGPGGEPFAHPGVAPLADLMVVKGGNGLFNEAMIVDGLVFLERQARALGRPMVVNLSLGSQAGPHDGSRLYEAVVDSLARPGFVVVFSAGNEGSNSNEFNPDGSAPARDPRYFHGSGAAGITREFRIEILPYTPMPGVCNDFVQIGVWYEAADRIDVSVIRPDGSRASARFGGLLDADSDFGHVRVDNGSRGVNPRNQAYEADVRIDDCGGEAAPQPGSWTLRIEPTASASGKPYHLWMWAQSLGGSAMARGRRNFDNHYVISAPGNARSAITVGAFASSHCWRSPAKPEGPVCFSTQEQRGDLARFSSAGPTRDGRVKPEITAPGLGIASAKSRHAGVAANRILEGGMHWINQGTSMAAPHVTGTIALMLEVRPDLSVQQIREIFARTADADQFTTHAFDNSSAAAPRDWWGFGKLNVCAALGAAGIASYGNPGPVVITPAADTLPVNASTRFYSCSPAGGAITFSSAPPEIARVDANGGVHALRVGVARIVAQSGEFGDTATVVVTEPGNLRLAVRDLAPDTATPGPRGTRLPLLATVLRVNGFEAIHVTQLAFRLSGHDAGARFMLILDRNQNGEIDADEPVVAARTTPLNDLPMQVEMPLDSVVVAPHDSVNLIAALELSGSAPNAAAFLARAAARRSTAAGTTGSAGARPCRP
jgi:subtilisin family serine protease